MATTTGGGIGTRIGRPLGSLYVKFGVLAVVMMLVLAGAGVMVYTTTSDSLTRNAQAELQTSAAAQSEQMARTLDEIGSQARWTTGLAPAAEVSIGESTSIALGNQFEQGAYAESVTGVHMVDTSDGTVVASSGDAVGQSLEDVGVTFFGDGLAFDGPDDVVMSRPYGPESEKSIALFVPVPDRETTAVMMTVDANELGEQFAPPAGGSSYLVHHDAEQIVLSTKADHVGGSLEEHSVISSGALGSVWGEYGGDDPAATAAGEDTKTDGHDDHHDGETTLGDQAAYVDDISHHGNPNVGGASVVEDTGLVLVTQVPRSEAFGLRSTVLETFGVAGVLLVLSLAVVGVVIARTTSAITDLSARAARVSEGEFDVDVDSDRSDEVGQLYDDIDEMRDSLRSRIEESERLRRESERLTEHLQATAREYGDTMQACAEGDLTRRMPPDSESEPMRTIAEEFNHTVTELERAVHETRTFTDEVATVAEQIDERSEGVADASEQVAESIDRISDGAARQSESLQSVLAEMQDLSSTVEEIASTSNGVASRADRAVQQSEATKATAEDALDGLEEVRSRTRSVVEQFERLDDRVDDVARLVDHMGTIATQTNRLALNANIEASRAETSEEGGFAAVADEIRDLANESKTAAEEAEEILEGLQTDARESAETVDRAATEIDDHAETFGDVLAAIDDLGRLAEETSAGMDEISAATEQQAAAAEEVVSMVEDVAAIAEETTSETQTVAAAAQQQSAAATDLSESASRLAGTAADLADTVDEFETRPDDERGAAPADD